MPKRKRGPPEVFRRAYGDGVRTLEETLLSLLPPPPSSPEECSCNGHLCFGCIGASFLLRPEDGREYRRLLTRGFCVVSADAPRFGDACFDSVGPEWMQKHFRQNGNFLSIPAWYLLLDRIGDPMMNFLLNFTSVFVPISNRTHHQIAGPLLNKIVDGSLFASRSKRRTHSNGVNEHAFGVTEIENIGEDKAFSLQHNMNNNPSLIEQRYSSAPSLGNTKLFLSKAIEPSLFSNKISQKTPSVVSKAECIIEGQQALDLCKENHICSSVGRARKHPRLSSWKRNKRHQKVDSIGESLERVASLSCGRTIAPLRQMMKPERSYCSIFQMLPKVNHHTIICRKPIFYNSAQSCSALPRNHILNQMKPNISDAVLLIKHILGISSENISTFSPLTCKSSGQGNCLCHLLLKFLKTLIRNAKWCESSSLLQKHCFVRQHFLNDLLHESSLGTKRKHIQIHAKESSGSYCSHEQVVSFIWAVSRRLVPRDLLGNCSMWRAFRKNISKFVKLRRYENFSLKQCMEGLKMSSFTFLSGRIQRCGCISRSTTRESCWRENERCDGCQKSLRKKFLQYWIKWYFSVMVVPIIKANFYVTEKEGAKHDIFYYPKPVWRKLVDEATTFLQQHNYRTINSRVLRSIIGRRSFGFSKVRFLPKKKGARPVANLKAQSKTWFPAKDVPSRNLKTDLPLCKDNVIIDNKRMVNFRSVNSALGDLVAVCNRIKIVHPHLLGSSVFDYNDIYRVLQPFVSGLRNTAGTMPKVFIVVSDVSKAFDSINQDKLLSIMKDILQKDVYYFRRFATVICTKKSLHCLYKPVSFDKSSDDMVITKLISSFACSSHSVLVDQGTYRAKKLGKLHELLHEHVKANVVQLRRKFCLQQVGISQGSTLSSILCSFYYGRMEKEIILPFLDKNKDHSCYGSGNNHGYGDDLQSSSNDCDLHTFLESEKYFVTLGSSRNPSLNKHVKHIFDTNDKRWKNMGRHCNETSKSLPEHVLLRFIDDFLFISTSEKQASSFFHRIHRGFKEYNCYMNNDKFGANFDMGCSVKPVLSRTYTGADGVSFLPWSGLLVNCQTLEIQADYTRYWAVHMSSTLTVSLHDKPGHRLQAKLLAYMRPKCHPLFYDSHINSPSTVRLNAYQAFLVCAMKFHCYILSLSKCSPSPKSCAKIINKSFSYMYKLIKKRMYETDCYGNVRPLLRLKKLDIVWLGLSAYIRVLQKKQSRHSELLALLNCKLNSCVCVSSAHLKYAVDDSHSSFLWKIKY